jgi:hypothetical protein
MCNWGLIPAGAGTSFLASKPNPFSSGYRAHYMKLLIHFGMMLKHRDNCTFWFECILIHMIHDTHNLQACISIENILYI